MSTKVYHGYRLVEGTDLFEFTASLRKTMDPIRRRLDAEELMRRAVRLVDTADVDGVQRPSMPLLKARDDFAQEQREMNPAMRGHDPHRFEVSFGKDQESGRIMCLLYVDQREYTKAWKALPEVESYGYWDNTDRADGCTKKDWVERKKAWKRVLGKDFGPPIRTMVSFNPFGDLGDSMLDLLMDLRQTDDHVRQIKRTETLVVLEATTISKRKRARNCAIGAISKIQAAHLDDNERVRAVNHLFFTTAGDPDNFEEVIYAAQSALNDDVVDYILNSPAPGEIKTDSDWRRLAPVDLAPVEAAAVAWVAAHGGGI